MPDWIVQNRKIRSNLWAFSQIKLHNNEAPKGHMCVVYIGISQLTKSPLDAPEQRAWKIGKLEKSHSNVHLEADKQKLK